MNRVIAFIVFVLIVVFAIGFATAKVTAKKPTSTALIPTCENVAVAVKITEVSASSTPQFTTGKGTVLEPQSEAGKEIPVSIPKPFHTGNIIKQCVNIVIE